MDNSSRIIDLGGEVDVVRLGAIQHPVQKSRGRHGTREQEATDIIDGIASRPTSWRETRPWRLRALASTENVENGSTLVADVGATMTDIVAQVQKVSRLIEEISQATVEQTQGIAQVNEAVTQLDQMTQQNAALVEESAAASASLSHQAERLVDAVGIFRLRSEA